MLRFPRLVLALVVVGAVTCTLALFGYEQGAHPAKVTFRFEDTNTWRHQVASGKNPVFVRRSAVPAQRSELAAETFAPDGFDIVTEGKSLGRLSGLDLQTLIDTAERQLQIDTKELESAQSNIDRNDSAQALREADCLLYREFSEAAIGMIKAGDYLVVTQRTASMIKKPPRCGKRTISCTKDGKPAIAVILIPHDEHKSFRNASDYRNSVELWHLEELVTKFNHRPHADRERDIARYNEIRTAEARTRSDELFVREQFPSGIRIDEFAAMIALR